LYGFRALAAMKSYGSEKENAGQMQLHQTRLDVVS
jgi:hypothetical protein